MLEYELCIKNHKYRDYKKSLGNLKEKVKTLILVQDEWNDYGYYTHFGLFYCNDEHFVQEIGRVNICNENMKMSNSSTYSSSDKNVNTYFYLVEEEDLIKSELSEEYCSIPNSIEYYRNLQKIFKEEEEVITILNKLRDITILSSDELKGVTELDIFETSLLRYNKFGDFLLEIIELNNDYSLNCSVYKIVIGNQDAFKKIRETSGVEIQFFNICQNYLKDEAIAELIVNYINYVEDPEKTVSKEREKILNQIKEYQADKLQLVEKVDRLLNTSSIHTEISDIKKLLCIKKQDLDKLELGHYTSMENLKYLLTDKTSTKENTENYGKLRLTNARQLNDPMEGKVLLEYMFGNEYEEENFIQSYLYLSSTTTMLDSLPMWKQYTDDADGMSLLYDKEYLAEILNETSFNIFKVCYLDLKNDGEIEIFSDNFNENEKKRMKECLFSLKRKTKDASDSTLSLLNSISYLFKNKEYAYEHEYRIIVDREKETEKIFLCQSNEKDIPMLYTHIQIPIKYSAIKLGPKARDIDYIGPYIKYCDDKINVSKSDISFR